MMREEIKPCPFCGAKPGSIVRPATEGETVDSKKFVHFISCYCGGYSATAHKMGRGETCEEAGRDAATKWNKRASDAEIATLTAKLAKTEKQLADAMKDAQRYRLVRRGQRWSVIDGIGDDLRGDALDTAIDAAIRAMKEE